MSTWDVLEIGSTRDGKGVGVAAFAGATEPAQPRDALLRKALERCMTAVVSH